jgi:hypothetical protein
MDSSGRPDWQLLLEIGLVLVLIGLGINLFFRPAAEGILSPRWWHWLLLGGLFFGVVGLRTLRRKGRSQRDLHETIRRESDPSG